MREQAHDGEATELEEPLDLLLLHPPAALVAGISARARGQKRARPQGGGERFLYQNPRHDKYAP